MNNDLLLRCLMLTQHQSLKSINSLSVHQKKIRSESTSRKVCTRKENCSLLHKTSPHEEKLDLRGHKIIEADVRAKRRGFMKNTFVPKWLQTPRLSKAANSSVDTRKWLSKSRRSIWHMSHSGSQLLCCSYSEVQFQEELLDFFLVFWAADSAERVNALVSTACR